MDPRGGPANVVVRRLDDETATPGNDPPAQGSLLPSIGPFRAVFELDEAFFEVSPTGSEVFASRLGVSLTGSEIFASRLGVSPTGSKIGQRAPTNPTNLHR